MNSSGDIQLFRNNDTPAPDPTAALDPSAYSRATITWKIDKFSTITESLVRSNPFRAMLQPKSDNNTNLPKVIIFYLRMVPSLEYPYSSAHTVMYLHSYCVNNITIRCRFSVVDATGKQCLTQDSKIKFLPGSSTSFTNGYYSLVREHILNPISGLLKDDSLTIFCEIELIDDSSSESKNHSQLMATSKVLQDFDSLLESAKYADVLLVVGKARAKKEFHAHKNILTARSVVFGAMFQHKNTKEAQESKVVIPDVKSDVFEHFIRYIYTGKVTEMDKYAQDLLTVADKYQMDCLKSLCSHYLSSKLTVEVVASILVLADLHNAAELKSNCVDYIADHAAEVMAHENWKLIKDKPELLVYLFQNQSVKRFKSSSTKK